ncbi:hypothetical protein FB451DRAFT_1192271 [Mycena latifolia]|nr:hypothetical protein FB451DRAFT_1192271 [Mycena latifolia]
MTTRIWVRFEGLQANYFAKQWRIPNHTRPFEPIPDDTRCIIVPRARSLFINGPGDRHREEISLNEASTWGLSSGEYDQAIYARAKTANASKRFCLRMILNVMQSTSDIHSSTFQVYDRLVADAIFHSTHLLDAEGLFVPLHYGMWVMDTGDWAGKVLFSITQWCGVPWNDLAETKMNTEANRILVGRTFEALHDYGIDHGGGLRCSYDFRHVTIDVEASGLTEADLMNGKAPCYIVDFSEARANHQCARKLPILPLDAFPHRKEVGCREIADVLILLKFMRMPVAGAQPDPTTHASQALEWHAKYCERHPDVEPYHVLIAQRERLFHGMPPVYPDIDISFEDEDLMAGVTVTQRAADPDEEPEATETEDEVDGLASTR